MGAPHFDTTTRGTQTQARPSFCGRSRFGVVETDHLIFGRCGHSSNGSDDLVLGAVEESGTADLLLFEVGGAARILKAANAADAVELDVTIGKEEVGAVEVPRRIGGKQSRIE